MSPRFRRTLEEKQINSADNHPRSIIQLISIFYRRFFCSSNLNKLFVFTQFHEEKKKQIEFTQWEKCRQINLYIKLFIQYLDNRILLNKFLFSTNIYRCFRIIFFLRHSQNFACMVRTLYMFVSKSLFFSLFNSNKNDRSLIADSARNL